MLDDMCCWFVQVKFDVLCEQVVIDLQVVYGCELWKYVIVFEIIVCGYVMVMFDVGFLSWLGLFVLCDVDGFVVFVYVDLFGLLLFEEVLYWGMLVVYCVFV